MFGTTSMKKYLLIAFAVGGLSLATASVANARPHGPQIKKMLFKDLDLSEAQRTELKEMRQNKKQLRKDRKKGDRKEWMMDFINGELSRRAVHADIDEKFEQRRKTHKQNLSQMFDFVDGLEQEQRSHNAAHKG